MKIALVAQPWDTIDPPSASGGSIGIVAYNLAKCLVRHHHTVICYAKQGSGDQKEVVDDEGIKVRRFRTPLKPWYQLADRVTGFFDLSPPLFARQNYYRSYAERVATDAAQEGVDVIQFFTFFQYAPIFRKANPNAKIVLSMAGEMLSLLNADHVEPFIKDVDLIVGCSDFITGRIAERFPGLHPRCKTLLNGVDHERFVPADATDLTADRHDIVYAGRISPEKGIHVLVEAFNQVSVRFPQTRLHLIGAGGLLPYSYHIGLSQDPIEQSLKPFYGRSLFDKLDRQIVHKDSSYINELKRGISPAISSRIIFHGQIPNAELADWYRKAAMLVFPSAWNEPFGLPLTEALASGIPVVSTRSGGIPEFIEDGVTGLLVPRDDASALASAIIRLLDQPDEAQAMARRGRKFVIQNVTWEKVGDTLDGYYRELHD